MNRRRARAFQCDKCHRGDVRAADGVVQICIVPYPADLVRVEHVGDVVVIVREEQHPNEVVGGLMQRHRAGLFWAQGEAALGLVGIVEIEYQHVCGCAGACGDCCHSATARPQTMAWGESTMARLAREA